MSGPGTLEFEKQWALIRATEFTQEPPCLVDDTGSAASPVTGIFYLGRLPDGQAHYTMSPAPFIPGVALVWHEMGHDIQREISDRTGNIEGWLRNLFDVRGAPWPISAIPHTNSALTAAVEQACSMLPEAFIGQWGGYQHPLYDNINDPAGAAQKVQDYFASPVADKVRWFLRNYKNWQPQPVIAPPPSVVVPPPAVVAPPVLATGGGQTAPLCYFSQWDADHVGRGDCVPTSIKMALCLYGVSPLPSIAEIRTRCDVDDDGVIDLGKDAGVTLAAAAAAMRDYGVPASALLSADVPFDDVLAHVREGRPVIVFVVYGQIADRLDQSFGGLHAFLITAAIDDALTVMDPDRDFDHSGNTRGPVTYDRSQVEAGYNAGRALGGGAVIPDLALGKEEDLDQDKFNKWFDARLAETPEYVNTTAAIKDALGGQSAAILKLANDEKLDDAEVTDLTARIDKLRTI